MNKIRLLTKKFIDLPVKIHEVISGLLLVAIVAVGYPIVKNFPEVASYLYVIALMVMLAAVTYFGLTAGDPRLDPDCNPNYHPKEYYVKDLAHSFIQMCWKMPTWLENTIMMTLGLTATIYGVHIAYYLDREERHWWRIVVFAALLLALVGFMTMMADQFRIRKVDDRTKTPGNRNDLDTPPRLRDPNRDIRREMAEDVPPHPQGEDYFKRPAYERRGIKLGGGNMVIDVDPGFFERGGSWTKK